MGYNEFHKGFKNIEKTAIPPILQKKKYGVRSIEEIIHDRYQKRTDKESIKKSIPIQNVDYQQNMMAQRNLRNLDK